MRDPFLARARDGVWHLLWTTAWDGVTIGHASSRDLIEWSMQRALPVMAGIKGTRNVWAPEAIWDDSRGAFVMLWASTVEGRFTQTAGSSEDRYNHRLYYTTTRDFVRFADPALLWDPGFSVIDATFLRDAAGGLHVVIKDETAKPPKKHLRITRAASPTGPFGAPSPPISADWVEGPTAIRIGEWTHLYYDIYRDKRYGAVRSRDLVNWENIDRLVSFPTGARHGAVVRVSRDLIERLDRAG